MKSSWGGGLKCTPSRIRSWSIDEAGHSLKDSTPSYVLDQGGVRICENPHHSKKSSGATRHAAAVCSWTLHTDSDIAACVLSRGLWC